MMLLMCWNFEILYVPRQVARVNKNLESWILTLERGGVAYLGVVQHGVQ